MPRTKEFDPELALERATELFWRQGYDATSAQDLVDEMGIGRGSLYATFGSKHALYERALDRYRERQAATLAIALDVPGRLTETLRELLTAVADRDAGDPDRRGCLLINAAMELGSGDPEVSRRVGLTFDEVERVLQSAIAAAQARGELSADRDPEALAHFLHAQMLGLRVLGKATGDRRRLQNAIDGALVALA